MFNSKANGYKNVGIDTAGQIYAVWEKWGLLSFWFCLLPQFMGSASNPHHKQHLGTFLKGNICGWNIEKLACALLALMQQRHCGKIMNAIRARMDLPQLSAFCTRWSTLVRKYGSHWQQQNQNKVVPFYRFGKSWSFGWDYNFAADTTTVLLPPIWYLFWEAILKQFTFGCASIFYSLSWYLKAKLRSVELWPKMVRKQEEPQNIILWSCAMQGAIKFDVTWSQS